MKNHTRVLPILLMVLFYIGSAVNAAEYYVSIDGSDLNGDGSEELPFRTVSHSLVVAFTDDSRPHVIHIGPGRYLYEDSEVYPLAMIDSTTLSGDSPETTFLDAIEGTAGVISAIGVHDWTIENLTLTNGIWIEGGAVQAAQCSNVTIRNVIVDSNRADNPYFPNTQGSGGGIQFLEVENGLIEHVLFINNTSYDNGGAFSAYFCSPVLNHVTIVNNQCDEEPESNSIYFEPFGEEDTLFVSNSIIWNNVHADGLAASIIGEQISITYSLVENDNGDVWPGEGNFHEEPLFTIPLEDVSVLPGSPVIDSADPEASFDNEPVPNGERANVGYYGNTGEAQLSEAQHLLRRNTWSLIGLPVVPPTGDIGELIGDEFDNEETGPETWQVWQWSNEEGMLLRYGELEEDSSEHGDPVDMVPGLGYLVRQSVRNSVYLSVPGDVATQEEEWSIPLDQTDSVGYHMVANPYPYPINITDMHLVGTNGTLTFNEAADLGLITRWVYALGADGRMIPTLGSLAPWQGIVIRKITEDNLELQIEPERNEPNNGSAMHNLTWGLWMNAQALDEDGIPAGSDNQHLFGISTEASDGIDALDAPLLDWLPSRVRFRFTHEDTAYYYHDIRPQDEGAWRIWVAEMVGVEQVRAEWVEFSVTGFDDGYPGEDYDFWFEDLDRNVLLPDLRDSAMVRVPVEELEDGSWRAAIRLVVSHPDWVDAPEQVTPVPEEFAIRAMFPNPFNSTISVQFSTPRAETVHFAVYDLLGREVDHWNLRNVEAGLHRTMWAANGLSSGVYFLRVESNEQSITRKMILLQ